MISVEDLERLLPAYLSRQRWYPGGGSQPDQAGVEEVEVLRGGWPGLARAVARAEGVAYHLVLGLRPDGAPAEFLHGHDASVLGVVATEQGPAYAYDALVDAELALSLLEVIAPDQAGAARVRPVGGEQTNTSLVYDDKLILKVFRRLPEGANPEVEVTTALAEVGFAHVARPVAVWRHDGTDLAILQDYLAGGTDGFALALTSLRDLYADRDDPDEAVEPAAAGGDFAAEADRLGTVTAQMHVALAEAFGSAPADPRTWAEGIARQLDRVLGGDAQRAEAEEVLDRLRGVSDPGASIRVHGDYHLGQVMRTDDGWFVLDFEGEPARPLAERVLPSSPLKDVAGLVRSFHYATYVALFERGDVERRGLEPLAAAWEDRNRQAFLEGYLSTRGIEGLVPADRASLDAVLSAFELDKAVYELAYELGHRPEWAEIPQSALARLLHPPEEAG